MIFVQKARCRKLITTQEKLDNDRFLSRGPGDTHVSLGLFFTSEWSSKQRICIYKYPKACQGFPETLLLHLGECFFLFGRMDRVLGGCP